MITVLYALAYKKEDTRPVPVVQYMTIENCCNTGMEVSPLIEIERLPHDKGDGAESVAEHLRQCQTLRQFSHYRYIHV